MGRSGVINFWWILELMRESKLVRLGNRTYRPRSIPDESGQAGSKPRGESVDLFLEFTINPRHLRNLLNP